MLTAAAPALTSIVEEFKIGVLARDVGLLDHHVEAGSTSISRRFLLHPTSSVSSGCRDLISAAGSIPPATAIKDIRTVLGDSADAETIRAGGGLFANGSLGGAVQDGYTNGAAPGRKTLGSTALFRESLKLGYQLTPTVSLSAFLDHMSNADLARHNAGLTDAGARLGFKF